MTRAINLPNNVSCKPDEVPTKFDKIKKMAEILYSIRPEIVKYCWDSTIFRESEDLDVPEELTGSRVEVEEERTQKVAYMMDQMYIEEDNESDEEVEFVDLIPVPDAENVPDKTKVQSKITSFFAERKQK